MTNGDKTKKLNTMIDQNYVRSMGEWFKQIDLSIEQVQNMIDFHEKEIVLHGKLREVLTEGLKHDQARREKAKEEFEKYLAENASE